MKQIDITVCLTTYKRPQMLKQAIESYVAQSYLFSELLVIDDCVEDKESEKIVKKFQKKDKRIRYIKNKSNVGFSKNLLNTFLLAKGRYLYVLGDDDYILGEDTLEKYIKIFNKHSSVDFIYSNIIQFNNKLDVDYYYNHFPQTKIYKGGKDAIKNIWLKSMYIGGIGLRKSPKIKEYYPKDSTLFPIVELIGKLLLEKGGCGFSNISIGMRVHPDQLGVHVMQKKRVKEKEKHGYLELYRIADRLTVFIREKKIPVHQNLILDTVNNFLGDADKTILLTEGVRIDKNTLFQNIFQAKKEEKRIFHTPQFWIQFFAMSILPSSLLVLLKNFYIVILRSFVWTQQVTYFKREIARIHQGIS